METKLAVVGIFTGVTAIAYWFTMRATPGKGWLRLCEKVFVGIALIYLTNLLLEPLRVNVAISPLAGLSAGCLGFPGIVLAFVVQNVL